MPACKGAAFITILRLALIARLAGALVAGARTAPIRCYQSFAGHGPALLDCADEGQQACAAWRQPCISLLSATYSCTAAEVGNGVGTRRGGAWPACRVCTCMRARHAGSRASAPVRVRASTSADARACTRARVAPCVRAHARAPAQAAAACTSPPHAHRGHIAGTDASPALWFAATGRRAGQEDRARLLLVLGSVPTGFHHKQHPVPGPKLLQLERLQWPR